MPENLIVDVERGYLPAAIVVTVAGELDFGTVPQLTAVLEPEIGVSAPTLVLDLEGLLFCDSSGLGLMISTSKAASQAGGRVYLVAVQSQVLNVLTMTSLDQLFEFRDDVASAVAEIVA